MAAHSVGRRHVLGSLLLFFAGSMSGTLYAQGLGSIVGTVTDPTGGVLPAATVKIIEEGTSQTRETTTNVQGYYVMPSLRPSSYTLKVEAPGFSAYTRKGVILQADQVATVNFAMVLKQAQETITVEAPPSQIDTSTATLSEVVDRRRIVELPLNGRNAASLALIAAGTVLAPASADEGNNKTFPAAVTISANGSRQNQASFRLDGANNNDIYTNVNQPFPFPDSVQEFSVQTSNYSARYGGNAGGVVNVVTKSGANELHGDVFEFNRNSVFNARNFFASSRDKLKRNQFGGTFGGPLTIPHLYKGKDKTFFFVGYQGTRIRDSGLGKSSYVPTPANLNGDFSSLLNASDPNNPLRKRVVVNDVTTGQPFPNNLIPTSRFDPAAVALTKYLPITGGNGQVLYGTPVSQPFDETVIRVDHSLSGKDRLTGRYFYDRFENSAFLDLKNYLSNTSFALITSHNVMLNETHTFTPTFLNDFRISVAREVASRGPAAGSINLADLGVKLYQPPGLKTIEGVNVNGYFNVSQTNPASFVRDQYSINDVLSWVRGAHSMTFGADITRGWVLLRNQFHQPAAFSFSPDANGDAMASYFLGIPRTFLQGNGEFKDNRINSFGLFFQDDFHISRRLTLNLGVRFDPFFPWKETKGRVEVFYPDAYAKGQTSQMFVNAPPGLLFPGDSGVPKYGLKANLKNFAPRLGFAYDLAGNGRTSIRGGFGVFYDAMQNGIYNNRFVDVTPFSTQINLTAPKGTFSDPYLGFSGGNPFPAPYPPPKDIAFQLPVLALTYDAANGGVYKTPVVYGYNLMLERQLAADWLIRAGFVGSQSRHLLETQELSPAVFSGSTASPDSRRYFKQFTSISLASQDINSNYNSLQVTAQKRFSRGFTLQVNYTWSKSMDDMPFGQSVTTVGSNNSGGSSIVSPIPWYMSGRHQFDVGPSEFDVKQRVVTSFVWDLPKLTQAPAAARLIAGGWRLSGLFSAQSGTPVTVFAGKDQSGTALGADRGVYAGGNVYGSGACGNSAPCVDWVNPAAFALPTLGSYGNVGKGALRGPSQIVYDGSLLKEFRIRSERTRLEFRAEFFNLFNRANLFNPGRSATSITGNGVSQNTVNLSNAGYGSIKAAGDPRIGQLALKIVF
jgi:hypothetical protein